MAYNTGFLKYLFVINLFLFTSSFGQISKAQITGNWFSFNDAYSNDVEFDYKEIYITDSLIHICNDNAGYIGARYYKIENDSLFFFQGDSMQKKFQAKLYINESKMIFKWADNSQWKWTRLKDQNILENFVKKDITEEEYSKNFRNRLNNQYRINFKEK